MSNLEKRLGWNLDPIAFEGRPEFPVEHIIIQAAHGGDCPCPLCGGKMENVFSTDEIWGTSIIVRIENMPTYYCYEDDYAKSDLTALVEFHESALERLSAVGDFETAEGLSYEIWAAKTILQRNPGIL